MLRVVLLPYLAELGDRWSTGEATVAQEHFASNLIRGRLLGIGRGWDGGDGPRVFWPVRPASWPTLGLIAFGLTLELKRLADHLSRNRHSGRQPRRRCRLGFEARPRRRHGDLRQRRLTPLMETLRDLGRTTAVAVGAGAEAVDGVRALDADPVSAALSL